MSVSGICQICESREAEHSCSRCGRVVCDADFEEGPGVCAICTGDAGGRGDADEEPTGMGGEEDVGPDADRRL